MINILNKEHLPQIDKMAQFFHVPCEVGRLSLTISNYGGFKAGQWYNWITVYFTSCFNGFFLMSTFKCWSLFV